jgi:hypothetical protein
MCAEERKVSAKGAIVAIILISMGGLGRDWGAFELGIIKAFTLCYWDVLRVGSVLIADERWCYSFTSSRKSGERPRKPG